jgi:transcriptional regulator with XRE-family HTH domain
MSVAKFADLVGLKPPSVYRLEKGEFLPDTETLVRWADACGVPTNALIDECTGQAPTPVTTAPLGTINPPLSADEIAAQLAKADDEGEAA